MCATGNFYVQRIVFSMVATEILKLQSVGRQFCMLGILSFNSWFRKLICRLIVMVYLESYWEVLI